MRAALISTATPGNESANTGNVQRGRLPQPVAGRLRTRQRPAAHAREVVPNPINTDRWQPVDQRLARQLIGIKQHCPLILFGNR